MMMRLLFRKGIDDRRKVCLHRRSLIVVIVVVVLSEVFFGDLRLWVRVRQRRIWGGARPVALTR
jgi:hypothetical protein